ncbi:MAG: biopolymer transporter ExbD [Desulfoarculaceae bacterium]|nr:biopolymer transporter ExbD [Desulfoarculaceae bacterium]
MHFEGRKKVGQGLNLTPLIDVVFLLLIFFMLTSNFIRDEMIPLALPTAETGQPLTGEKTLQVVLDNQGRILIDQEAIAPTALEEILRQKLHLLAEKRVQLRGDQAVSLGLTVEVLDAARKAGAEGIDIITREP